MHGNNLHIFSNLYLGIIFLSSLPVNHNACSSTSGIFFFSSNWAIAMQTQVAEYKQLKDTLNRIPSFRRAEPAEQPSVTQVARSPQGDTTARENPAREPQEVRG